MKQESEKYLILVAGLGYFVDIYDLLLFGIVRVQSLKSLGLMNQELLATGVLLVNLQMLGMLLGGLLWGILGDKKGRLSVLYSSILIYSLANIFNAFTHSVFSYGAFRFIAGFGLAGELGAAITLVSETMGKTRRGLGTTLVTVLGILGAVAAGLFAEYFNWRVSYFIGGLMGLLLLGLRLRLHESAIFKTSMDQESRRGDLLLLFTPFARFCKYLRCILVGVPIWFVIGVLITFAPELSQELFVDGTITAGKAIFYCYIGSSLGNLTFGLLAQYMQSRRKVMVISLSLVMALIAIYLTSPKGMGTGVFYALCGGLGFATGYWVVFLTSAAELFGTNMRATVTTSVPNFVRGSVVLITTAFLGLKAKWGLIGSAMWVGSGTLILAYLSLLWTEETYGRDLNFYDL